MKSIFNWTVGSFFRTIGRLIAYALIGAIIGFLLMYKPKAATLTPKSTYTDNTNHIIGQDISSFGSNNTYSYSTTIPNLYGEFAWSNASTGTAVSGKAYALSLGFQYNLTAQKYYDITFNFRDRDLRSVVNTSSIELLGGTSISGLTSNNLSLIGVTNNATSSNNTNKLVVRVYSVQALSYFVVQIYNMQNNITSVNNFGISSVSIQEVDITNSQAIINNQTNNTQNIINNQNDTTQQIIDSNKVCREINKNDIVKHNTILTWDGQLDTYNDRGITDYISVISLNLLTKTDTIAGWYCFYDSNYNLIGDCHSQRQTNLGEITLPTNAKYLRATIVESENKPTFRVCQNGNQATSDSINHLNDTLTDTDTQSDSNDVGNFLNNISLGSHNTLSSIITLPINMLNSLLDDSSTSDLCTTYKNKQICLPNGKLIWGRDNPLINTFKLFFQLVVGGFLSYKCLSSIVRVIEHAVQPDKSVAEVMKL